MRTVIEETVDGHRLTVVQCIAPGVGFWYNGHIDGEFYLTTGDWPKDKNTKEDCYKALLAKLKEITNKEK